MLSRRKYQVPSVDPAGNETVAFLGTKNQTAQCNISSSPPGSFTVSEHERLVTSKLIIKERRLRKLIWKDTGKNDDRPRWSSLDVTMSLWKFVLEEIRLVACRTRN